MLSYRDQLEGTAQLFRIRRLKRVTLVGFLILAVILAGYAMVLGGASLKPIFLPLDAVLPLLLVVALIANIANFVFRALEMRHAKRDSQRFLIARNAIRRATAILIVSLLIGGILILPPTGQAASSALSQRIDGQLGPGAIITWTFTNQDPLAFARFTEGRVAVTGSRSSQVFVSNELRTESQMLSQGGSYRFVVDTSTVLHYEIRLENLDSLPLTYRVNLDRVLMPQLTTTVPVILIALAASNVVWIAYLRPLRQKYESSSIYSIRYVEEPERGETTYARYVGKPVAVRGTAVAPPPPPVEVAPAAAAEVPPPPEPPPPPEFEKDIPALMESGSRSFSEGRFEQALASFDEVLEVEPQNVLALLAGAAALRRLKRSEEALSAFASVLEIDPRHAKALASRAQIFEDEQRWEEAAGAWGAYLEVVPVDIDGRLHQAEAWFQAGDRPGAIRALEEAMFLAPADDRIRARLDELRVDTPALLSKALVASASGKYEEALGLFERILTAEPENVNALVSKGVALRRAGRTGEALEAFDSALARQPTNAAALRAKGQILEAREAYADALEVYEQLLETAPRNPELWALQASVLENLGEHEEALASYHEALKIEPGNREWVARAKALEASRRGHETFLEELFTVKGVGPARARALLAAGYDSPEAIRKASDEELARVRGVTRKLASALRAHFAQGDAT